MDGYNFSEVKGPRKKRTRGVVWDVLTILVLFITLFLAVAFYLIYTNPNSILNPFPPPGVNRTATPIATPRNTVALAWTPTREATQVPSTSTPAPTITPPLPTVVIKLPTNPPETVAGISEYAFIVRQGSPAAIDGSQFHPDAGCHWSGVAGQATSLSGEAVKGVFVQLGGSMMGVKNLENIAMTGLAPQYGQGGFEITIADRLFASQGTLWIQLVDQQNLPLSERVYFDTYEDCTKNLVIIYFDQVR